MQAEAEQQEILCSQALQGDTFICTAHVSLARRGSVNSPSTTIFYPDTLQCVCVVLASTISMRVFVSSQARLGRGDYCIVSGYGKQLLVFQEPKREGGRQREREREREQTNAVLAQVRAAYVRPPSVWRKPTNHIQALSARINFLQNSRWMPKYVFSLPIKTQLCSQFSQLNFVPYKLKLIESCMNLKSSNVHQRAKRAQS